MYYCDVKQQQTQKQQLMTTNIAMIQFALINGFDLFFDTPINSDKFPEMKDWKTIQLSRIRIAHVDYKESTTDFLNCRFEGFNQHILVPYHLVSTGLKHTN